jgi:hypothetical protein
MLSKAFLCERWHCLPSQIDNEDWEELTNLTTVMNTYQAFREYKKCVTGEQQVEFSRNYPDAFKMVMEYLDNG